MTRYLISTERGASTLMTVNNVVFALAFFVVRVLVYWAGVYHLLTLTLTLTLTPTLTLALALALAITRCLSPAAAHPPVASHGALQLPAASGQHDLRLHQCGRVPQRLLVRVHCAHGEARAPKEQGGLSQT